MTKEIQLRTVEAEDLPFLHKLFNDPDVMDFWFSESYTSMQHLKEEFKEEDHRSRDFIITNDDKEQIGLIGLYEIEHRHRHAEFAIALDPIHQGNGYATKATRLALDYAFFVLNLHKVHLTVLKVNEKAHYIYEKVGFQIEGNLSEHFYINGEYHDGIIMSIFHEDYVNMKKES